VTYVIAKGCVNDASCVAVCPVDCIRPRPEDPGFAMAEQLYIDPQTCTDCSACMTECPVSAIHDEFDMPEEFEIFKQINAEFFQKNPLDIVYPGKKPKRRLREQRPVLRIAIVGAGASGCYAAEELAQIPGVEISVFDRQPTPFGLVRAGVAPDHQATKEIAKVFGNTLGRSGVSCYFNVDVGEDVSLDELLGLHHAVVLAVGAASDRTLGIPGEDLRGSYSARQFVGWYNGDPGATALPVDLSSERVVIIGNGNVSMDVTRILAAPAETFEHTDMPDYALDTLRESKVREVLVVARRGPADAAYTLSELWQLTQLEGVDVVADAAEVEADTGRGDDDGRFGSVRKVAMNQEFAAGSRDGTNRKVSLRYYLIPEEIGGNEVVESITFRSALTGESETFETGLVLRAIGYRVTPVAGLPFDEKEGRVRNEAGRIIDPDTSEPMTGLYCTGWVKRGATGVIGTNKFDSQQTVSALFEDYESGALADPPRLSDDVATFIEAKCPDMVDFADWQRVDAVERARGEATSRIRSKLITVEALLAASRS
jgi:ferredoxin/flavodoxin---NADP+ reductase